jgi:hypothetical protein
MYFIDVLWAPIFTLKLTIQEAFRQMEVTGKVQSLPPALVGQQHMQSDVRQCTGDRKQRRPLQSMQATPSSLNSSVQRPAVSLLSTRVGLIRHAEPLQRLLSVMMNADMSRRCVQEHS